MENFPLIPLYQNIGELLSDYHYRVCLEINHLKNQILDYGTSAFKETAHGAMAISEMQLKIKRLRSQLCDIDSVLSFINKQ